VQSHSFEGQSILQQQQMTVNKPVNLIQCLERKVTAGLLVQCNLGYWVLVAHTCGCSSRVSKLLGRVHALLPVPSKTCFLWHKQKAMSCPDNVPCVMYYHAVNAAHRV
jgi:hypothetical protein